MIKIIRKSLDNSDYFDTIKDNYELIINKICYQNNILKEED